MNRSTVATILISLTIIFCLAGCGGGGNGGTTSSNNNNNGYLFGERQGVSVYMQPGPPAYSFPPLSGPGPGITIDQVTPFSSNVNPAGTSINQATTQVVYGQVTGSTSGMVVVVYSYTNSYYIQPLTGTTININSNSSWISPANPGQISALLVAQGYTAPDTTATLPVVDGVNVFAVATQP